MSSKPIKKNGIVKALAFSIKGIDHGEMPPINDPKLQELEAVAAAKREAVEKQKENPHELSVSEYMRRRMKHYG